jgi:hypothetical protein
VLCSRLDLFSALAKGATAAKAANRLRTDERATEMLMNALVALGVLQKEHDVFRNMPLAAQYLTEGSLENVRLAMMHTAYLWHRWSTLTECVRTGTCQEHAGGGERDQFWTEAFIAAQWKDRRQIKYFSVKFRRRFRKGDRVPT